MGLKRQRLLFAFWGDLGLETLMHNLYHPACPRPLSLNSLKVAEPRSECNLLPPVPGLLPFLRATLSKH